MPSLSKSIQKRIPWFRRTQINQITGRPLTGSHPGNSPKARVARQGLHPRMANNNCVIPASARLIITNLSSSIIRCISTPDCALHHTHYAWKGSGRWISGAAPANRSEEPRIIPSISVIIFLVTGKTKRLNENINIKAVPKTNVIRMLL